MYIVTQYNLLFGGTEYGELVTIKQEDLKTELGNYLRGMLLPQGDVDDIISLICFDADINPDKKIMYLDIRLNNLNLGTNRPLKRLYYDITSGKTLVVHMIDWLIKKYGDSVDIFVLKNNQQYDAIYISDKGNTIKYYSKNPGIKEFTYFGEEEGSNAKIIAGLLNEVDILLDNETEFDSLFGFYIFLSDMLSDLGERIQVGSKFDKVYKKEKDDLAFSTTRSMLDSLSKIATADSDRKMSEYFEKELKKRIEEDLEKGVNIL